MSNQTVEYERARERRMFQLFMFLTKRPDLPANDPTGGDNQRAKAQPRTYTGAFDDDFPLC